MNGYQSGRKYTKAALAEKARQRVRNKNTLGEVVAGGANVAVAAIGTVAELVQGGPTGPHPAALAAIDGQIDGVMESMGVDTSSSEYSNAKDITEVVATLGLAAAGARIGSRAKVRDNDIEPSAPDGRVNSQDAPATAKTKASPTRHNKEASRA